MESTSDTSVNTPLRAFGFEENSETGLQAMGLVMSRAGLGKTAILVQFALDCMMNKRNVLHIAIGEGVDKTRSWYDDIISVLDVEDVDVPELMSKRMIMTFKESNFRKAVLAERIEDLVQQGIFKPECLVVDGFDFDNSNRETIEELRTFAAEAGVKMMWFSAVSHRGDDRLSANGVPAPCHDLDDLFETALVIEPEGDKMQLNILKCETCAINPGTVLSLDPSTMLIQQG